MVIRNSALDFVFFMLSERRSIASTTDMSETILRRWMVSWRSLGSRRSSSRRVPEAGGLEERASRDSTAFP